jgi:hypothetical protein
MYQLVGRFGEAGEHPVFQIEINADPSNIYQNSLFVYATQMGVDETAIALSKEMPNATINILAFARHKATYKNGVRTVVRDMKMFYSDLTDEQYEATQFKCSIVHNMV